MYYSYDNIVTYSIILPEFVLSEYTLNILSDIKKQLLIYKQEPFVKTIIHKQEDYCGIICKLLNKLSEKNYDKLKTEMFDMIKNIDKEEDITIITTRIFNIASSNIYLSKLFAKLYSELININNQFLFVFQTHFKLHTKLLSEIMYYSPNDNYDQYCNYVKQIERLKAGLCFFSNLMKYNICSLDNMVLLCLDLMNILKTEMLHANNMEYKEELLQSIFIIIKETYNDLVFSSEWEHIYNYIVSLKTNNNINNKLKFKCMDIIDFVNKQ